MAHTPRVQCTRQKGRNPYYTLRVNKKLHYLGTDVKAAYRKAAELLADVRAPAEPQSVAELVVAWLHEYQHPRHREFITPWAKYAGAEPLAELGQDHFEKYIKHLKKRGLSAWTIRKYFRFAMTALKWAVKQGWSAQMPDKPEKMPVPLQQPRDVDYDLLVKAFGNLSSRPRAVLLFILSTGCRPGEATHLRWEQVDLRHGVCLIAGHKTAQSTGRTRTIYLTPTAREILKQIPHRTGHVFLNRSGRPYTPSGLRSILRRHGISRVYSLRHTAAQSWLDQGVALEDVAKLLGHADLRTVQVYAQVRDARARHVAANLASPLQRQPSPDTGLSGEASPSPRVSPGKKQRNQGRRATGTDR